MTILSSAARALHELEPGRPYPERHEVEPARADQLAARGWY
jgi:hypothetical protein